MSTTYTKGRYQAKVLEQGFEASRVKGTPGFFLQLKILRRYDEKGQLQDCPQFERTYVQYLANETGVSILRGDLKAIGVEVTDLAQLDPEVPNHINLVGREIDVMCEIEARDGREQERWGISGRQKLATDAIRELSTKFNHLLQNGDGNADVNTNGTVKPPKSTGDRKQKAKASDTVNDRKESDAQE